MQTPLSEVIRTTTNATTSFEPCCYPGIRCNLNYAKEDMYNIFVVACLPETMKINSVAIFQPMWETVLRGLQSRDVECGYRVMNMASFHANENLRFPMEPQTGDVIILVGHESWAKFIQRCRNEFASRGVYCIWYYSEHEAGKADFSWPGLCEVWEYTRSNNPKAPLVRHIPAGFLPQEATVAENDDVVLRTVETHKNSTHSWHLHLQFVGSLNPNRSRCLEHLRNISYFDKTKVFNRWGFVQWRELARQTGVVYLNMHRYCNDSSRYVAAPRPLETVRLSSLLSAGGVVISEETNEGDTQAFDGIVLFEPNLFQSSDTWSPRLRHILTDPQAFAAWQLDAYNRFKDKFSPTQILLAESVWDGGLAARAGCPGH